MIKKIIILIFVVALVFVWKNLKGALPTINNPLNNIENEISNPGPDFPLTLADDFTISVFAKNLGKARDLNYDPNGVVVVSNMTAGEIIALPDKNKDGIADKNISIYKNLYNPHGILFDCDEADKCKLYVAETNQVAVLDYDPKNMTAKNKQKIVDLPNDGGHYTRSLESINIGGTKKLLISVGSSCNVCEEADWRRSKILISNMDGSDLETYASGLRNSVFLTTNKNTNEIWATDMGRDWLGDDTPPDEVNIIKQGNDYGWPICYGKNIHDTNFDNKKYIRDPCEDKTASHIDLQAHSAPLGLDFFDSSWPETYRHDLLIAYHGSWNRSVPTGYKIIKVELDENGSLGEKNNFVSGWLENNANALGRPVDILINNEEKNIFVSDDKAGLVYLLEFSQK